MKIINAFLAVLFIYFAFVQINDPDPVLWVLVYAYTAMVCIQTMFGKVRLYFIIVGALTFIALAATKLGGVIDWMQAGEQSEIFGEMTGERPYIEDTREFFGLIIALTAIVYNWLIYRKTKKKATA